MTHQSVNNNPGYSKVQEKLEQQKLEQQKLEIETAKELKVDQFSTVSKDIKAEAESVPRWNQRNQREMVDPNYYSN